MSVFRILSCTETVGSHLCVIFHPWHSVPAVALFVCLAHRIDRLVGQLRSLINKLALLHLSSPKYTRVVTYEAAVVSVG